MFTQLKMGLLPQTCIINYALDSNLDKTLTLSLWRSLRWPFPLRVRTRAHVQHFPHRRLETSLSCPRVLFRKKNECIVAFGSHGNNFWNRLTVKSNGFALFQRWNWCQYAKLACLLVLFAAFILSCGTWVKAFSWCEAAFPCSCLMGD